MSLPRIFAPASATNAIGLLMVMVSRYTQGGTMTVVAGWAASTICWSRRPQSGAGTGGSTLPRDAVRPLTVTGPSRAASPTTVSKPVVGVALENHGTATELEAPTPMTISAISVAPTTTVASRPVIIDRDTKQPGRRWRRGSAQPRGGEVARRSYSMGESVEPSSPIAPHVPADGPIRHESPVARRSPPSEK